ncbi:capsular biosynthesis protein [Amylibacter sp.]|nr:capsular biosynthesis protein [Amylibacter sp.]
MKKIALIGFDRKMVSSIKLTGYKIIDANEIFGDINSLDQGNMKNSILHGKINLKNCDIDSYWRIKGEFEHYANRRIIPKSFEEQDILFRYILSLAITLAEKVDLMIFSNLPHQGVDSVINNCAKMNGIPTYYFTPSIFKNFCYLMKQERNFENLVRNPIPLGREHLQSFNSSPKQFLYYMQKEFFPQKRKILNRVKTILRLIKIDKLLPLRIILKKIFNHFLHSEYRKIKWLSDTQFDKAKLNLYFPLHLQPELTTSNMGGVFYDQNYAISKLIGQCESKNLSFSIYLKENPKQSETHRAFLNQFKANKNVHFVGKNYPSDLLIENCDIVCTISGTAGWEAIKSGKPCFIFGKTWYETAPGVQKDIKNINMKIKTQKVDTNAVKNWFLEHQGCLHLLQNDTTIPDMASLVSESRQTLKSVIELVF